MSNINISRKTEQMLSVSKSLSPNRFCYCLYMDPIWRGLNDLRYVKRLQLNTDALSVAYCEEMII